MPSQTHSSLDAAPSQHPSLPSITLTKSQDDRRDQPPSPVLVSPWTPNNATGDAKSGVAGAGDASLSSARWASVPNRTAHDETESAAHPHPYPHSHSHSPSPVSGDAPSRGTWRRANDASAAAGQSRSSAAMTDSMGVQSASSEKQRKFRISLNNVALSTPTSHLHSSASVSRDFSRVNEPDAARSNEHLKHAIDPLSSHIIKRTSAAPLVPQYQPRRSSVTSDSSSMRILDDSRSMRTRSPSRRRQDGSNERARDDLKRGVKAVSFISRLIRPRPNKGTQATSPDTASIISDIQPEGNEAEVFAQSSDPAELGLRSTKPPAYIKVRSKYKERSREFDRMFLAQELSCGKRRRLFRTESNRLLRRKSSAPGEAEPVWAMEFSRDGKYLSAAGADTVVRVWKVLASSEDRRAHENQELADPVDGTSKHSGAPVFQSEPWREYRGHEAPVLDLSWSTNSFLLSSSMDKTVRLWHMSRTECICTFRHNDFVPSIAFHPKDDRYFLTGSLDAKLRLWSLESKSVVNSVVVPDMITAVAFMPDGKSAVAGTLNGSCLWYETDGFKYKTQLQIRPDRGQGAQGPKITGISTAVGRGGEKVLITSNDSRTRLYNVRDKGCEIIFKGNVNDSSQIRAGLSDDGRYVVCGSEDRRAYIWSVTPTENGKLDRRPVEYFDAHDSIATVVRIAPTKTRRLLDQSEDPVYDLCNAQHSVLPRNNTSRSESYSSSKPSFDPALERVDSHEGSDSLHRSASLLARSAHKDGGIIVTADYAGKLKVFRQDCAWHRRQREGSERGSLFKRGDRSSMASSLQTKSSQRSLREAKNAAMAQVASTDRIHHWRQDIAGTPSTSHQHSPQIKAQSRPESPGHIDSRASQADSADTAISENSPSTIPTSNASVEHPLPAAQNNSVDAAKDLFNQERFYSADSNQDPLFLDGQRSYMFWDKSRWLESSDRAKQSFAQSVEDAKAAAATATSPRAAGTAGGMPLLQPSASYVSQLSAERSEVHSNASDAGADADTDDVAHRNAGSDDEGEHFDDAVEHQGDTR